MLMGTAGVLAASAAAQGAKEREGRALRVRFCLNTATIRGQKLPLMKEVEIAAKAGYSGIEPWIGEIDAHVAAGGTLRELAAAIKDAGLVVESAIGFPEWVVDEDGRREKGLEEARRAMDLVAQLGGTRLAAPPAGATDRGDIHPLTIAERYRALCALGQEMGVTPMLEVWGFSRCVRRLGEAAHVVLETDHPRAAILADVYHLYKGGSPVSGLRLLQGALLPVFHMNDYPTRIPPETIGDGDRVFPGDGNAPLSRILSDLNAIGFEGALSLELFNRDYYQRDALEVARTGLEKMKQAVAAAAG